MWKAAMHSGDAGGVSRHGDDVVAIALAAVVSGLPSTVHAIATGRDALAASTAAGTLVPGHDDPSLLAGVAAHLAISAFWGTVIRIGATRFPRHRVLFGALAGASIAA